jgi:cytochrome P450
MNLQHLNGFINEVLRLLPPAVMTGMPRSTGPDGLVFGDFHIPPFTKLVAPRYAIMRCKSLTFHNLRSTKFREVESAFLRPDDFIPERWYSRPELIKDQRAFAPFSTGPRQCTGKALAYAELRYVAAMLVRDSLSHLLQDTTQWPCGKTWKTRSLHNLDKSCVHSLHDILMVTARNQCTVACEKY